MISNKLNILLADDDRDDRHFFEEALKELNIPSQLTTVDDGEKLMNYLSENSEDLPTVLFLDLNMPRKNGAECLLEIKRNKKLKDLPVIIYSTSFAHNTIDKLFKSGAHVYIRKPSDFTQLKQVIHHAIPLASENIFKKTNKQLKYILNA